MVVKADWFDGDTFAAADENAHAAQTNTNTTDIADRVVGEASSADSEVALFSGTGGKTIKRATGTGIAKLTSGVLGTATAGTDYVAPGGALGTPSSGNASNLTNFPTLNQNTTGSAATLTTGRTVQTNLASTSSASFNGSANITPGVTGTLAVGNGGTGVATLTGIVKGNGTSAFTAAVAGTDYYNPGGTDVAVADGGTGASSASSARTNLGLAIGTDILAYVAPSTAGYILGTSDGTTWQSQPLTRVFSITSSATPSINVDTTDQFNITALAAAITSVTITGTPRDGQKLMLRVKDNGTARAIAWGASFQSSGVATLLATTVAGKTHYVGLIYNSTDAKWTCIAVDAAGY